MRIGDRKNLLQADHDDWLVYLNGELQTGVVEAVEGDRGYVLKEVRFGGQLMYGSDNRPMKQTFWGKVEFQRAEK